jgi:malonate transporter and related proteins
LTSDEDFITAIGKTYKLTAINPRIIVTNLVLLEAFNLLAALLLVAPIFAWIAFGSGLRYFKLINPSHHKYLTTITFSVLIPILLFFGTYSAKNLDQLDLRLLLAFYLPLVFVFGVSLAWFRRTNQLHPSTLAMSACYSNNVLLGIPILLQAIGEMILLPAFIIVSLHTLVLFSLALWFQLAHRKRNYLQPLLETLRNPIVFSLILGLSFNLLGIKLPEFVEEGLSYMKHIAVPCALIVLGSSLATFGLSGQWKISISLSVIKLLVLPTLVYIMSAYFFALSHWLVVTLVILSASPIGVNAFGFAEKQNKQPKTIGAAVLVSTFGCIITQTIWLSWLQNH